jgi:hypothetical protein
MLTEADCFRQAGAFRSWRHSVTIAAANAIFN